MLNLQKIYICDRKAIKLSEMKQSNKAVTFFYLRQAMQYFSLYFVL